MLRVVVSVCNEHEAPGFDLEIPAAATAERLDRLIAHALNWEKDANAQPLRHTITIVASGRKLSHSETLADVDGWDGNCLRFGTLVAAYLQSEAGTYPLYCPELMLGRGETDGWRGDSLVNLVGEPGAETVSRQHARLANTKGQWQISHLSQHNETVLNGHVLAPADRLSLQDGDKIELGAVQLTFHVGYGPDAT